MDNLISSIQRLINDNRVVIYGAHLVAKELYQYLLREGYSFEFEGFAVTSKKGNPNQLDGQSVFEIQDILDKRHQVIVIIAMPEKFHQEVVGYLIQLGFERYMTIGLGDMSRLKGRQLIEHNITQYTLQESSNDCSWLDLFETNFEKEESLALRHYKFPTLSRMNLDEIYCKLEKFSFYKDYERVLGEYRNVHELLGKTEELSVVEEETLDMYMVMCHKDRKTDEQFIIPKWTHGIQAGTALTDQRVGEYADNCGDNISLKNKAMAEMTATYWVWKNGKDSFYKGICHYRRHFELNKEDICRIVCNDIDVVLTTPRVVLNGIRNMFMQDTPVKEEVFESMLEAIDELYGAQECSNAKEYFEEKIYYPNNMLVARKEVFNEYCSWIFPILFKMEAKDENKGIYKNNRHIAYAAELLTSFYFMKNKKKYKIAVTDYIFIGKQ